MGGGSSPPFRPQPASPIPVMSTASIAPMTVLRAVRMPSKELKSGTPRSMASLVRAYGSGDSVAMDPHDPFISTAP
jgi:hypothetical protein